MSIAVSKALQVETSSLNRSGDVQELITSDKYFAVAATKENPYSIPNCVIEYKGSFYPQIPAWFSRDIPESIRESEDICFQKLKKYPDSHSGRLH